jgi:hypothetical protein
VWHTQITRFGAPIGGYLDDQPADQIGGSRPLPVAAPGSHFG